jgi:hypothetical protein
MGAMMRRKFGMVMSVAVVVALIATSVALATPNSSQYENPAKSAPAVSSHVSGAKTKKPKAPTTKTAVPAVKTAVTPKQTLPFTGLSLLVFALVGGGLVVSGLALRRTATSRARR